MVQAQRKAAMPRRAGTEVFNTVPIGAKQRACPARTRRASTYVSRFGLHSTDAVPVEGGAGLVQVLKRRFGLLDICPECGEIEGILQRSLAGKSLERLFKVGRGGRTIGEQCTPEAIERRD